MCTSMGHMCMANVLYCVFSVLGRVLYRLHASARLLNSFGGVVMQLSDAMGLNGAFFFLYFLL
jgi:hypothetical protein